MRLSGRIVRPVLGSLIGLAGLIWIFKDLAFAELVRDIAGVRWAWVVPAVACDTLGYLVQGARWALLLRPAGRVGALRATQAVYAGLFVNEILPMRVGEVVRSWIVAGWLKVPILRIVPSMAAERLFDGLWLGAYIGIVAIFVTLPETLIRAADILGASVLAAAALFLVLILWPQRAPSAAPRAPRGRLARGLTRLRAEALLLGHSPAFYLALAVSALPQALEALAFWFVLRAFGIPLSLWAGLAAALILRLGTVIPSAPGNVGTWQLICVLALTLLGVDKQRAAAFSLVAFVILTVPLWAIGWPALTRTGLSPGSALRLARADRDSTASARSDR